jgi:hypothetical protein
MIQIDLDYLKQIKKLKDISIKDGIFLYLLYNKEFKEAIEWSGEDFYIQDIGLLELKGYIKIIGENLPEDLDFRPEYTTLVTPINTKINFDEFWDAFPTTTRTGRILRAVNKTNNQCKPTRDYEICKKKYLSKVKSEELHKNIVAIIKARVASGDYEYINGMEIYINQCKWERDEVYLKRRSNTEFSKEV